MFACRLRLGICTSPHENSLNIKETMNNFLTCPVRIQVQNNQHMSRDSLSCICALGNIVDQVPLACEDGFMGAPPFLRQFEGETTFMTP